MWDCDDVYGESEADCLRLLSSVALIQKPIAHCAQRHLQNAMNNSTDEGCALLHDIATHPLTVPLNVVFLLVALSVTVSSADLFGMLLQTVTVPVRNFSKDKE